jgi:tuftelin-interacting protein 11
MLDDSDSDSNSSNEDFDDDSFDPNDPDVKAERDLFKNPYKHKRRKKNGKEDAIYGVFGSEDEEDDYAANRGGIRGKRSDWAKAPAFVSGQKVDLDKTTDVDAAMKDISDSYSQQEASDSEHESADEESAEEEDDDDDDDDDEAHTAENAETVPPSSERIDEDEAESTGLIGGLGFGASRGGIGSSRGGIGSSKGGIGSSKGGIGSSKGGIGSSKGGIGSSAGGLGFNAPRGGIGSSSFSKASFKAASVTEIEDRPASASPSTTPAPPTVSADDLNLPSSFGKTTRTQRAFVRDDNSGSGTSTPKPVMLSASERAHFNKLSGSFGARMLEKMGWQAGVGLGTTGEGIVAPVESKLRPKGMGLAFKGFKEKTEQSKAEARRRGEVVSEDETAARPQKGRKTRDTQKERSDAWKKPKKVKKKIEHKTYEQIVAEAGQDPAPGIGQIIDATGATVRPSLHVI